MKRDDIHWLDEEASSPVEKEYTEIPEEAPVSPSRKKRIALIVLVVLCITCIGAFFLSDTFYNMLHHQTTYTLQDTGISMDYTPDGVTSVQPFQELVVRINGNGAQATDTSGAVVWDVPFSMSGPYMVQAGGYAAVADLKGNQVCLLDTSGLISTITTESPIAFCSINENGSTAVVLSGEDSNTIMVYDKNANVLVRRVTYTAEDGIPIAAALNEDASRLATSYVIYTESELRSVITLFNLTDTSSQTSDKIAGNYSYSDSLITELRYMGDELIYIGDNRIGGIRITGNTSQDWEEALSYQITSFDFGSDFLAVLYGNGMAGVSGQASPSLVVYNASGAHTLELSLDSPEILSVDSDLIVYHDGLTYTAIQSDGTSRWYYTAESTLLRLHALSTDHAVAVTGSSIDLMKVTSIEEMED